MQPPDPPANEIINNIVNGTAQGAIGALIGVLGTLFTLRFTTKRREITYQLSAISLLRLTASATQAIEVTVDKPVLTGQAVDTGQRVPVHQAYAYEVSLVSTGNEAANEVGVDFELPEPARIASVTTTPETRPDYKIEVERSPSNPLRVWVKFPYLNEKAQAKVTIIGVTSEPVRRRPNPKVEIRARDVRVRKQGTGAGVNRATLLVMSVTVFVFVYFLISNTLSLPAPGSLLEIMAATLGVGSLLVLSFFLVANLFPILLALTGDAFAVPPTSNDED